MIAVQSLGIRQGVFSIAEISFTVPSGKYAVLMGKTGCGKTSIIEAIAGLRPIASGSIMLGESGDVRDWPPGARGIGFVPQDGALFPTMTVRENLAFALRLREAPWSMIHERVRELAEWLEIGHLLDRYPAKLSGGESQRVALGRALSFRPKYLLMDEPLSSLDETTREHLIKILRDVRTKSDVTILHVTHSRWEADQLCDLLFRLEGGKVHLERGGE
ncbi:MAG: ATP-binding cassette domain-containing protein [Planctomycetes bacterium]|nr:ATP-binding cassette domain-containing protein [Planctomycetota bacterium]